MPEWLNGAVSKTVVVRLRYRGFESHSLRQPFHPPPDDEASAFHPNTTSALLIQPRVNPYGP
jgi:hypothetical protein